MFDLKGKVAVVTGGGAGIGLQYVQELLRRGVKGVTLVDVNETFGTTAVRELQEVYGKGKIIFVKADVSDKGQFENAFKETVEHFKNVDILVNNAGIMDERQWEKEVAVNFVGHINGILLSMLNYISKYKSGEEGVVISMSSVAGIDPTPSHPIYCATKTGILSLARSFGSELHYRMNKVRIICICPGATSTELVNDWMDKALTPEIQSELKRLSITIIQQDPAHVAQTALDLVNDAPNGSIWVIEDDGKPYKIEVSDKTNSMAFNEYIK